MDKKKQNGKGTVIAAVIILIMCLGNVFRNFDPDEAIPILVVVVFITILVIFIATIKGMKGKTGAKKQSTVELHRPFPQPTAVKAKQTPRAFQHKDEAEEAVTCAHRSGREKYLEQVEGFYKNGLIDRAEYRLLREKYEKLDLPEDYH